MPIRILPTEVASQIAAGEVVERPKSVVKELVENSLDSGASQISIEVQDAGRRLIEVADNGCGIIADELKLAVGRHATSKLLNAEDLFHLSTLGFRGEALASIGSIAHMTIVTRVASTQAGARLIIEGGQTISQEAVGAPTGTLIRVEHLFYNVPARLKFLKNDVTERRQIDNLVTRYALAYPHVRFSLKQEGRIILQTSGNGERREILAALYGVDVAKQMLEVIAEDTELTISGFISPVALTRSNRREIHFFVNGRPIQDATLISALIKAYHTLLMVGRYPYAILFIQVPTTSVDVNVHPTKAEVRFRDPDRIFSGVQRAVRRALLAHRPVPEMSNQIRWVAPSSSAGNRTEWNLDGDSQPARNEWSPDEFVQPATDLPQEKSFPEQTQFENPRIPILRLIGQIANTYLVAEGPDGLYLVDQHAAHERVLFEKFTTSQKTSIVSQQLLQPVTVELSLASTQLLEDQLPILERLGFDIEPFGMNTFLVRALPAILSISDPGSALRVLVEEFEEDETPLSAHTEARVIARICKRAAVKAGKSLSAEEQRTLLIDLEACQSPRTCPHGRPTMIHISVDLLARQFGRRGAR